MRGKIESKRGMSDVISTVLIILLVLAAVGIIGAIILKNVGDSGTKIGNTQACFNMDVSPVRCNEVLGGLNADVYVKKGASSSVVSSVDLLFKDVASGVVTPINVAGALPQLQTTKLSTTAAGLIPASTYTVSVAARVKGSDGKESVCDASVTSVDCVVPGTGAVFAVNVGQSGGSMTISVSTAGTGYQVGQRATVSAGSLGGCSTYPIIEITSVNSANGAITGVKFANVPNCGTSGSVSGLLFT